LALLVHVQGGRLLGNANCGQPACNSIWVFDK